MPRITELPAASTLTGGEVLPIVQSGIAVHATTSQIITLLQAAGIVENRVTRHYPDDGTNWTLNGGSPISAVTKIFLNGVLMDTADFTIILANGTVFAPAYVTTSGNARIDLFWI